MTNPNLFRDSASIVGLPEVSQRDAVDKLFVKNPDGIDVIIAELKEKGYNVVTPKSEVVVDDDYLQSKYAAILPPVDKFNVPIEFGEITAPTVQLIFDIVSGRQSKKHKVPTGKYSQVLLKKENNGSTGSSDENRN